MRQLVFLFILLTICNLVFGFDNMNNKSNAQDIDTKQAMYRAQVFLGITDKSGYSIYSDSTTFSADSVGLQVPYLYKEMKNKRVWRVTVENISLHIKDDCGHTLDGNDARKFIIYIDSKSGILYGVISPFQGVDKNLAPEPSEDFATKQLEGNEEIFLGFPPDPPKVGLCEAIKAAEICVPSLAKELVAYYIMHSYQGEEPKPVWSITCRGIPPVQPIGRAIKVDSNSLYLSNRMRCVVDATTGKWLFATNKPQVELREKDSLRYLEDEK